MPRRCKRPSVSVTLTLPAEPPTPAEIDAILMATGAIISRAGRVGVGLILNGSRSQKALRNEWDKLPEYGALAHLPAVKIGEWRQNRRPFGRISNSCTNPNRSATPR